MHREGGRRGLCTGRGGRRVRGLESLKSLRESMLSPSDCCPPSLSGVQEEPDAFGAT